MMIKTWLLIACLLTTPWSAIADESHTGHSDALLILLQYKLKVVKLQQQLTSLPPQQAITNVNEQQRFLAKAMPILSSYMATPEGHYPNLQMYQQSLQSRSALLQDFNRLLQVHFQAVQKHLKP